MSHPFALTQPQRTHLGVAEADTERLTPLLRRANTSSLTTFEWLTAAALATSIADQMEQVADLAVDEPGRHLWTTSARLVRDTAARFELWADLAHSQELAGSSDAAA